MGPESLQSDLSCELDICFSIHSLLALIPSEGNFDILIMFLVLMQHCLSQGSRGELSLTFRSQDDQNQPITTCDAHILSETSVAPIYVYHFLLNAAIRQCI